VVWSELSSEFVSGVGEQSSVKLCGSTIAEMLLEIQSMAKFWCTMLGIHRNIEF
jgi:hypothetical protein